MQGVALKQEPYYTVKLTFNASGEIASRLLSTAWRFKIAVHRVLAAAEEQHEILIPSKTAWVKMFKPLAYEIIPNKRYSYGVVYLVYGIWESARKLGVDFKEVELGDWLLFQHYDREWPGNVIRVHEDYSVSVTTYGWSGEKDRILLKAKPNKGQRKALDAILARRERYMPRVVITSYGVRRGMLWANGEVHILVPWSFYVEVAKRCSGPTGDNVAGVDINTDRINLAILDRDGNVLDYKTFWFQEVTARGYPRRRAWSIIGMRVHDALRYAYHHGVKSIFLENPKVLGILKLVWIRNGRRVHENYNWKVATFRNRIIEMIAGKTPLYGMSVGFVDPHGTSSSEENIVLQRTLRVDRHTASAILIAIKGLGIKKSSEVTRGYINPKQPYP